MQGAPKRVTVAVVTVVSCAVLFCVPMVLWKNVYRDSALSLITGDVVPVEHRISTVWCSEQTLRTKGATTFEAYLLPKEPDLLQDTFGRVETYATYSDLKVAEIEYWGFYLPKGSRLNVSTCARLPGATLTVVRGQRHLSECLHAFHKRTDSDLSEESEESEEDDPDAPSSSFSSSEGVLTEEATEEGAFECPHLSIFHRALQGNFSCAQDLIQKGRSLRYLETIELEAEVTDHYYLVFSTGAILDLLRNEVHWSLNLERTTLDLGSSEANCSSREETDHVCRFSLRFGSNQVCFVKMTEVANESTIPLSDILESRCEPRRGLYYVFFLLIFLAIGFCAFH